MGATTTFGSSSTNGTETDGVQGGWDKAEANRRLTTKLGIYAGLATYVWFGIAYWLGSATITCRVGPHPIVAGVAQVTYMFHYVPLLVSLAVLFYRGVVGGLNERKVFIGFYLLAAVCTASGAFVFGHVIRMALT